MLPEAFIRRLRQQEYIDAESLIAALEEPSPVTIRVNRSKWRDSPAGSEEVPWCDDAFYLAERPSFTLDPLFHAGCYYPQEASGLFLEEIFRQVITINEGIKVLDLCAAPGGKSTHLSSLIGDRGLLVSNEVIRQRATVLAENLTKWGLSNVLVTQSDASAFGNLPGFFDVILIDAPCSGEGMFRDQIAIDEWSEDNAALCTERQKRILMDVWPALREDGILIYSTCTFNPEENEKNIKWLTEKQDAGTVRVDISDFEGITEIEYQGIFGYGFYPGKISGEGLFISVVRKTEKQDRSSLKFRSVKDLKISREEKAIVKDWSHFGDVSLIKPGIDIISIPYSYGDVRFLGEHLRIIKSGTRICSARQKNFLPSYELALATGFKKGSFPSVDLDRSQALSYLRRDNLVLDKAPKGWITVQYEGVVLGFANNLITRINNYFPVAWRIRMRSSERDNENIIIWETTKEQ